MRAFGRLGHALACAVVISVPVSATSEGAGTLVTKPSRYSVPQTMARIEKAVEAKGMKIFARIDHSGEAATVGLQMKPTLLLIFGNPNGGTPLMVAKPTAAIDLPMKALVWEDADGNVWVTYNSRTLLVDRHGLSSELVARLAPIEALLEHAAE